MMQPFINRIDFLENATSMMRAKIALFPLFLLWAAKWSLSFCFLVYTLVIVNSMILSPEHFSKFYGEGAMRRVVTLFDKKIEDRLKDNSIGHANQLGNSLPTMSGEIQIGLLDSIAKAESSVFIGAATEFRDEVTPFWNKLWPEISKCAPRYACDVAELERQRAGLLSFINDHKTRLDDIQEKWKSELKRTQIILGGAILFIVVLTFLVPYFIARSLSQVVSKWVWFEKYGKYVAYFMLLFCLGEIAGASIDFYLFYSADAAVDSSLREVLSEF